MILDIIILIILIVPMAMGLFRGFLYMLIHTLSWIGAVIAGIFLVKPVAGIMSEGVVWDMVSGSLYDKFEGPASSVEAVSEGLPDIISGGLAVTTESISDILVSMLASMIISVISFLLVVFLVKLVFRILVRPVAKRGRGGLLTGADKLAGLAVGFVEGVLLVFIFLALLVPVVNFAGGSMSADIVSNLKDSVIAGTLYDNNFLLIVTGGIFS